MVYMVLSMTAGFCWWYVADTGMRNQAANNARSVARVISQGGFTLNQKILQRMQDLSTYTFQVRSQQQEKLHNGMIQIPFADGSQQWVLIDYLNQTNRKTLEDIFWTSIALVFAGTLFFLPVAWMLAKRFARPLEDLSRAAQRIGDGEWDAVVATTGTAEAMELAQQLDKMRLQLQALDAKNRQAEHLATLGTFTATIAHEVRNPLSAVRLLIQMLMRDSDDQRLAHVEQELQRLDLIVDELLGFSAGMQVQLAPCDLHQVCAVVVKLLQRQAEHASVDIELTGGASVMGDERRLQQLLMNLLLNAIQAQHGQEGGGRITIDIIDDGFAVYDDGPGVAEDIRATLFSPFSSGKKTGTGLGLHLARSVAEAHNAQLSYHRENGDREPRTCFRLCGLHPVE